MARKVHVQYPGVVYYVMSRGDQRDKVFFDDVDRYDFLKTYIHAYLTLWKLSATEVFK
jgi:hypothetical protein